MGGISESEKQKILKDRISSLIPNNTINGFNSRRELSNYIGQNLSNDDRRYLTKYNLQNYYNGLIDDIGRKTK